VGGWRTDEKGPMQVVSNPYGRERVHFEAPAAHLLDAEMRAFLDWFNATDTLDPVLKAALAHLWFVTIHPFDDGNGRMARAIADMALARADRTAQRFYSMSAQIQLERNRYYDILEHTQKGDLEITDWLRWFLECLDRALGGAEKILHAVLTKAAFWRSVDGMSLNDRQRDMLNRLLDGFTGKLTSSKWAKIEKCSPDTALRDITDLVGRGILKRDPAGGRSTSYSLVGGPSPQLTANPS
jgi:Fic family protein